MFHDLNVSKHRKKTRTLLLGTGHLAQKLVQEIRLQSQGEYRIIGVISETAPGQDMFTDIPVRGSLNDLQQVITDTRPDRIIVALAIKRGRMPVNQLIDARIRNGIIVEDGSELYERLTGKIAIESITPSSIIFSSDYRPSSFELGIARLMSMILAGAGLIILAPLLLLVALAIKLDSRGPIFFTQDRLGLGERHFSLLKFRTMYPDIQKTSEWARDNTHRITRTGRWLRKYRIDELPQFLNVLSGDMNLVGPRPHPASNFELLVLVSRNTPVSGRPVPYYTLRSIVRPGITGWAQVRYKYANDIGEEIEKLRYDLFYVKHYSIWLDMRIIFETIKVVLLGRGASDPVIQQPVKI